jgi:hypothetical protein
VKVVKENLTNNVDHVNLIVFYRICFVLIGFVIINNNILNTPPLPPTQNLDLNLYLHVKNLEQVVPETPSPPPLIWRNPDLTGFF